MGALRVPPLDQKSLDKTRSTREEIKAEKQVQISSKVFSMDKSAHADDESTRAQDPKEVLTVHLHSAYRGRFKFLVITSKFVQASEGLAGSTKVLRSIPSAIRVAASIKVSMKS